MKKRNATQPRAINVILADDDEDDCLLFEEALNELPLPTQLSTVHTGNQLMARLAQKKTKLPDVIFLDLNMPGKNGFACLKEIKLNSKLENLPVFIFSTAFDQDMINLVYKDAAHYYIQKPNEFALLKKVILKALTFISEKKISLPVKKDFILVGDT
jgi:CheY-like chemotaxis protein